MSSQIKVRALLDTRLHDWARGLQPPLDVAWQNTPLAPNETHLRPYLMASDVSSDDLQGLHRSYVGIYQVSIVCPVGTGTGEAEGLAADLDELFPVNLRLTGNGITVQVMTPVEPGPAIQESHAWTLPVSFTVRSDTI